MRTKDIDVTVWLNGSKGDEEEWSVCLVSVCGVDEVGL